MRFHLIIWNIWSGCRIVQSSCEMGNSTIPSNLLDFRISCLNPKIRENSRNCEIRPNPWFWQILRKPQFQFNYLLRVAISWTWIWNSNLWFGGPSRSLLGFPESGSSGLGWVSFLCSCFFSFGFISETVARFGVASSGYLRYPSLARLWFSADLSFISKTCYHIGVGEVKCSASI